MKLFVILSRFPFPLEKGDKLRAYHQIAELSKKHEIILCCLSDKKVKQEWKEEIRGMCSQLYVFELSKPLIYWNTVKQFFSTKPYQVGYFYQNQIRRKVDHIIKKEKPDHIYSQLIRTSEYVKNHLEIPKTLDYMDALGKGMMRRAAVSKGIRKKLFTIEGKRLSAYENRIFDYFNHHTIISEQDRKFINHPENHKIEVIENGISDDFFHYDKQVDKEYDLVFTGNMNYPPNVACSEYIVNEVLPILQNENPDIRLLLSGANPSEKILELSKKQGVTVTGWVDDIRDSYAKGKIFIAPLIIGTGLQNKLLEAMAMGLPCITTNLANNALKAVDGESILLAEKAEAFKSHVLSLLQNPDQYEQLSRNGKKFVAGHFNWKNSVDKLEKLFNS